MRIFQRVVLPLVFVLMVPHADASNSCVDSVAKILSNESSAARPIASIDSSQVARVIGRELTPLQTRSLEQAKGLAHGDLYTPNEVIQQNRMLQKAGFTEREVQELRRQGVIGNSVLSMANGAPKGVDIRNLKLEALDSDNLKRVQGGEKFTYFLGENGSMHLVKGRIGLPSDRLVVINQRETRMNEGKAVLVREAGEMHFDPKTKTYAFRPKYGFSSSSLETRELIDNVTATNPGLRITYEASPAIPHSKVVKCLDVLSAQTGGKNFVLDRMLTDNIVTTTAIFGSELAGADRLSSETGRMVIAADIVGGNINGLIGAKIGKHLVLRDSNFATSMAVRTGMGLGMIESQKLVHEAMVGNEGEQEQVADDIAAFNRAHFLARLPVNHYFDELMIKKLPNLIFNSCQKRPALSVLISPRSIRLYERYASSVIYYGLRDTIVGQ